MTYSSELKQYNGTPVIPYDIKEDHYCYRIVVYYLDADFQTTFRHFFKITCFDDLDGAREITRCHIMKAIELLAKNFGTYVIVCEDFDTYN